MSDDPKPPVAEHDGNGPAAGPLPRQVQPPEPARTGALPVPGAATREAAERGGASPQPRNPLHGLTLEAIVTALADHYGWGELGHRIPIRCFNVDPSVGSSLKFLRKTPWAREKVEGLYLFMLREARRAGSPRP